MATRDQIARAVAALGDTMFLPYSRQAASENWVSAVELVSRVVAALEADTKPKAARRG